MKNKSFTQLVKESEFILAKAEQDFKNALKRAENKLKENKLNISASKKTGVRFHEKINLNN